MGKKLSEMSIEELWQLFPIIVTKHQSFWEKWYGYMYDRGGYTKAKTDFVIQYTRKAKKITENNNEKRTVIRQRKNVEADSDYDDSEYMGANRKSSL